MPTYAPTMIEIAAGKSNSASPAVAARLGRATTVIQRGSRGAAERSAGGARGTGAAPHNCLAARVAPETPPYTSDRLIQQQKPNTQQRICPSIIYHMNNIYIYIYVLAWGYQVSRTKKNLSSRGGNFHAVDLQHQDFQVRIMKYCSIWKICGHCHARRCTNAVCSESLGGSKLVAARQLRNALRGARRQLTNRPCLNEMFC